MNPFLVKYPLFLKSLYPNRITKIKNSNELYLTFDDGPIPEVTPWVLKELETFNARASFFCIGENVRNHPRLFQQVLEAGHSIGNHTYHHLNGWKTPAKDYFGNVLKAENFIFNPKISGNTASSGEKSRENGKNLQGPGQKYFRPPYGRITNSQAKLVVEAGYKIVMWDVLSGDFSKNISTEKCLHNVIDNSSKGSIVVFHDSIKAFANLQYALPRVLEHFSTKGYNFRQL